MDIDDPIQQLLKNTGWSCDDLLEKIQKYKSQKEYEKVSLESVKETEKKTLISTEVVNVATNNIQETNESKLHTHNCDENRVKHKSTSSYVNALEKEFSDTDEEEVEVNVTNSSIIDEIIDDIASVDNADELSHLIKNTKKEVNEDNDEEQAEITEVRVIEVDEDQEDDYFEEECSYSIVKPDILTSNSKNIEYLETFPRKSPKLIDLTGSNDNDDIVKDKNIPKEGSNQEKRIINNVDDKISISETNSEISNAININNSECYQDVLITTDDSKVDQATTCLGNENTDTNSSHQVREESIDKDVAKIDTNIIYNKSCEKANCDRERTTLDKIENESIYHPIAKKSNDQDVDFVEDSSTLTSLEDLRNNLKLQLNSLRTRKKGHFLQQLRSKIDDSSECNLNKLKDTHCESKIIASESTNTGFNEATEDVKTSSVAFEEDNRQRDLYTQTNELGLVILSVQGGIELGEEKNETNQDLNIMHEDSSNTINSALDNSTDSNMFVLQSNLGKTEKNETSGVFDEIRKIIRKQKPNNSTYEKRITTVNVHNNISNSFSRSANCSRLRLNDEFNEKAECSSASADNSQSSFTYDETSQNIEKNSPFVSNSLDEFLTGNSKLNISYNIPKSGAEEGLVDNYHEDTPLVLKKVVKIRNENMPVSKKTETIKAKTVAQKRKLLEKQRLKELKKQNSNSKTTIKQHPANDAIVNNTQVSKQKSCYIEINNKKLWVNGTKPNMCIAKIYSSERVGPPVKQCCRKRKLSLLTELAKKYNEKIKYRPGPLSKKSTLQVNGHDSWKTETKLLPKIILEVSPKIGHRLPSTIISRLPQCDGLVTADLAEFAISMLKTKNHTNTENKIFKFPAKYKNNQEKIIVKKHIKTTSKYHTENKYNEDKSINSVVASVIDDLIRYVEIKEIAPLLIKEEENEDSFQDRKLDNMPVIADNISNIIKKPQKKKSKVELELLRLNCKVVNVEVEENSIEESCDKPYCRLGCVCKSLKCDGMITYHCQNVTCMLECKCPRERSIEYDKLMLPAGTDILSTDTVTRIEDEAKKDMAKVEREFTQMVIHTNDKTIVVGTGGRHKTRRSTKAPIKYSDYIDSNFESIEEDRKVKTPVKKNTSKECFVSLEKLNLQGIVPYCMLHNLYSCHCDGKPVPANYTSKNPVINTNNKPIDEQINDKKPTTVTTDKKCLKSSKMSPSKPRIQKEFFNNSNIFNNSHTGGKLMSTSGRPIRLNKKLQEDFTYFDELDFQVIGCARTIGVPYNKRVKRRHSVALLNRLIKNDFSNNISQVDVNLAKNFISSSNTLEVEILKHQLILESENHKKSMSLMIEKALNESKHKRKQILEVRTDDVIPKHLLNKNLAIQRRKKPGFVTKRSAVIEAVFDGEIIVDERNMELLQKMGTKTVLEGYARLLPWTALINSFNKEEIQIWCMVDQPSRLLINKADKNPPKNYIDIRKTTQTTEVILWILRNKLPQRYHEDHISFILKQTKDNFEICGLCTKNLNDTNLINPVNNEKEEAVDTDTVFFKHKDLNGVQQLMGLSKGKFKLQELVEETLAAVGETSIEKNKLYMWAALPEVYPMCKWRMIFLNSDFTFLYFTKVKYSIKYTDLLSASNRAREASCTVILRNSIICNPNYHSAFGIYFDAHYQDRLFIGPYFKQHKDDDIETLRYINQSLVCTESFNKMQGKTDYKCGHWLVERPYSNLSKRPMIDLTKDIQIVKGAKRKQNFESPLFAKKTKFTGNDRIIITQNNDHIKVLDSEPKRPDEFNRYIITNIPHLGYLGAFQHEDTTEIDISWPFENKMLRFPSVSSAIDFLQCRFSSLLQPVPETFKINILVLTDIDLEKTKPIDVSILSGHYICGEFGCYNIKTVTNEFCVNKIGTSREELLRIFAKRAQIFVRQKIDELANVVNMPVSGKGRCDIVNILDKARKNIESLTELEKQNVVEKDDLLLRKRELALKVFCLISTLPEKEKSVENWKFRQILKKQSILLPKTIMEPIEILDSDDEENNTTSQDDSSTNQHVMCDVQMSSEAAAPDNGFTDQKYDLAEITPLPKLSPTKNPCSKQSGSLKPCSLDITVANKVNDTAVITYPSQRKLKSILKCNTTISRVESSSSLCGPPTSCFSQFKQSINKVSEVPKQQYLTGVKLIKTGEGKLMLVSDSPSAAGKPQKLKSLNANQLIIRNNEIMCSKSVGSHRIDGLQNFVKPDNKFIKIPISPPKTIILKKSALLKNNKISIVKEKTTLLNSNINSDSVLKNSPLIVPALSSFEGDNKDTDFNSSRGNDQTEENNLTNVITTNKQANLDNENKSRVERFSDAEIKNVTVTSEKSCVENCTNFPFNTEVDKITTDLSRREGYTNKKNCTNSPLTDGMVKITEDAPLEEDHTDKKPLTDGMVKITEDTSLEEDHTDEKSLTDGMVKITEDTPLEKDHTHEKTCVENCTNSPLNNEIDKVDKNVSLQQCHTKESHLKDCTNSLCNEMDKISEGTSLDEHQTDEKAYVENCTDSTFTNQINKITKDLSQKEYHIDEESKETEDVSLEENPTDEKCSVENCTKSPFTNEVDKITKDLSLKENPENEESPLENFTSISQFGEMDGIPKHMSLEEDQMDEKSCMETCTNSQPNHVVDKITENMPYTEEESSSENVIDSPSKDEITEDIILTKNQHQTPTRKNKRSPKKTAITKYNEQNDIKQIDNEVTGLVHPIISPDQNTKSNSTEMVNTTLEISDFGNPAKNVNQPPNSDISFLANNVSEIFPSKHGRARSEKDNITNTASLPQVSNAANDLNNLAPLENMELDQNGYNADSKMNTQLVILSNISETIHDDPSNITKMNVVNIKKLAPIIHTVEKSETTNSYIIKRPLDVSSQLTNETNKKTVKSVACAFVEEEITNQSDNFIVSNKEIPEYFEISIDNSNIQNDEQILDSCNIKSNTNLFAIKEETAMGDNNIQFNRIPYEATSHKEPKNVFSSNKKTPIENFTNNITTEQYLMSNEIVNIDEDDYDSRHNEITTNGENSSKEDKIPKKEEKRSIQSHGDCSKTEDMVNVESEKNIDTDRTYANIQEQHDVRFCSSADVDQNVLKANPTEVTLADGNVSSFESNSNISKDIQPTKQSMSKKLLCMASSSSHKKKTAGKNNKFKDKISKQMYPSSAEIPGKHNQFSSKNNIHTGKKLDTGMKNKRKKLNISKKFIHKSQLNNAPESSKIEKKLQSKKSNTDFTLDKSSFSILQSDIQKEPSILRTRIISNISIHTLEVTKENTKPNINKETHAENLIPKINNQISSVQNDIIEKPLLFRDDSIEKFDKNLTSYTPTLMLNNEDTSTSTNCNLRESSSTYKNYNCNINSETTSEITNNVIPKKPISKRSIKCANAKINTAFSIVNDTKEFGTAVLQEEPKTSHREDQIKISTFPHKKTKKITREPEKKGIGKGRRRKEMISTSDLIVASKIVSIANEGSKDIADKICVLAANTLNVTPVKILSKENFLKNAQLAEKMINIGDMKKKLQNNIYEDNGCQISVDKETNLEITREQDCNTRDGTETKH